MDVVADQAARKLIIARASHQITRVEATEPPVIAVTGADFVQSVRAINGFVVVAAPDQAGAASVTAVMAATAELVIAQAWGQPRRPCGQPSELGIFQKPRASERQTRP